VTLLAEKKVGKELTSKIAALGNGKAITQAIKLIGSGMNPEEAIRQAKALKTPKAGKPSAVRPPPRQIEMTDDEWLRTHCSMILSQLKHKAAFKKDAILYRRGQELLAKFRGGMKKFIEEAKSQEGHNGAFFAQLYRLLKCSHPQHWLVCGICLGDGKKPADPKLPPPPANEPPKPCPPCMGAAYRLKLDD
jgi:hypothetical protein